MTLMTPFRRTILHLLQIFLTEALTFIDKTPLDCRQAGPAWNGIDALQPGQLETRAYLDR